jgi:hypothetical protein
MSLIPEYKHVKGVKCGICVQAKQPRKPFHTVEGRSTTLSEGKSSGRVAERTRPNPKMRKGPKRLPVW